MDGCGRLRELGVADLEIDVEFPLSIRVVNRGS